MHHLLNTLLRSYKNATDWEGTVYSGMKLKWDYQKRTCEFSIPGYITYVLSKLQHDKPKQRQHTPSKYVIPVYGAKMQYATRNETPHLSAKQCINIQISQARYYTTQGKLIQTPSCHSLPSSQSKKIHIKDASCSRSASGLPSNTPQCNNPLSCIGHDSAHP